MAARKALWFQAEGSGLIPHVNFFSLYFGWVEIHSAAMACPNMVQLINEPSKGTRSGRQASGEVCRQTKSVRAITERSISPISRSRLPWILRRTITRLGDRLQKRKRTVMEKPIIGTPAFGMSRVQAAHHIGIGVSLFDSLVAQGKVPPPRKISTRLIWLRHEVEDAVKNLPYANDPNERPLVDNAVDAEIARRNRDNAK